MFIRLINGTIYHAKEEDCGWLSCWVIDGIESEWYGPYQTKEEAYLGAQTWFLESAAEPTS